MNINEFFSDKAAITSPLEFRIYNPYLSLICLFKYCSVEVCLIPSRLFFCCLQNFIKSDGWSLQANLRGNVKSIRLQIPNSFNLAASPQSMEGSFWRCRQAMTILIYNLTLLKICFRLLVGIASEQAHRIKVFTLQVFSLHLVWYIHLPNTCPEIFIAAPKELEPLSLSTSSHNNLTVWEPFLLLSQIKQAS